MGAPLDPAELQTLSEAELKEVLLTMEQEISATKSRLNEAKSKQYRTGVYLSPGKWAQLNEQYESARLRKFEVMTELGRRKTIRREEAKKEGWNIWRSMPRRFRLAHAFMEVAREKLPPELVQHYQALAEARMKLQDEASGGPLCASPSELEALFNLELDCK